MVVVAIIAALAAISIPGFLRARKRSQATIVLNDVRLLDSAKDQYAMVSSAGPSTPVTADMLTGYLRPGTRLYKLCAAGDAPTDVLGNPYVLTTFDAAVKVNPASLANFDDVIEDSATFWAGFQ